MLYEEKIKQRVKILIKTLPSIFIWENATLFNNILIFHNCRVNKTIIFDSKYRLRKGEYISKISVILCMQYISDKHKYVTILDINDGWFTVIEDTPVLKELHNPS